MRLWWFCLIAAFSLLVSTGVAQDKAGSGDKDKLQGTWSMVSGKESGKDLPAEKIGGVRLVFAGDKLIIHKKDEKLESTIKLDPTKKPKEIDVDFGTGETGRGIYELDGDTLKLAHGNIGDPRPKDFVSTEDSKVTIVVLKREKDAK